MSPARRMLIATVVAATCAGCTTIIPGQAASENPIADPPEVGTCLALATEDVEVMTTFVPRLGCDDPGRTAQVYATADLTGLDAAEVTDLDRDQVAEALTGSCDKARLHAFLGADLVETPFVFTTFFTPIPSQWELGARWAYCVVAYGNENDPPEWGDTREVQLAPRLLQGAFNRSLSAIMRTCSATSDGDVPCSEPHSLEYIGMMSCLDTSRSIPTTYRTSANASPTNAVRHKRPTSMNSRPDTAWPPSFLDRSSSTPRWNSRRGARLGPGEMTRQPWSAASATS